MMLEIENNLKNDATGAYKRELLEKFSALGTEVRGELNKGLAPDEYVRLNQLLQAVEASITVVEAY